MAWTCGKALETYTVLTIGDGLVTVIPALMISISGGLIVTRASSDARLGAEFHKQISGQLAAADAGRRRPGRAGAMPGMPKMPFLLLGGGAGAAAGRCGRRSCATAARGRRRSRNRGRQGEPGRRCCAWSRWPSRWAWAWSGWWRAAQESPLLRRISAIRRQLASDLGYLLPPVRVTDNLSLRSREYVISLKGVEIARYELPQGCELAIPTGNVKPAHRGAGHARAGFRHERAVDSRRARRTGAARGLHGGGQRQRAGHAPLRS